jgi:hypothetical protein
MSRGSSKGDFGRCMFVDCVWLFRLRVFGAWCGILAELNDEQYVLSLIPGLESTEDAD